MYNLSISFEINITKHNISLQKYYNSYFHFYRFGMADLVSSSQVFDIVYDVVNEQLGRKKNFIEILSATLKVSGDFQVTHKVFLVIISTPNIS